MAQDDSNPKERDPRDPDTWMWDRARAMIERADRLQRTAFRPRRPGARRPNWEPPVDVFETEREVWLVVALPGVAPGDVQVELHENVFTVRGQRLLPDALRAASVHRLEIPHGLFERQVELPPGTYTLRRTQDAQGCLLVQLEKQS